MKKLLIAATLSMCSAIASAQAVDPLSEYRWTHRVLIAFASHEVDSQANSLRTALAAADCELEDRDMVIGWILSTGPSRVGEMAISSEIAGRLRSGLGIQPDDFAVLLIGKDGGVKARYDSVPALDEVFALIDGMPMRRSEMRKRTSPCAD